MWIVRQMFNSEWEESEEILLRTGLVSEYACEMFSMYMNDGLPLLVAHNIRNHALLFHLINHPKDCPAAYYYLWQNMVVEFSDLDASYSFRYINGNHEGNLPFTIEDVCDAIQTLGPLLDGRPT